MQHATPRAPSSGATTYGKMLAPPEGLKSCMMPPSTDCVTAGQHKHTDDVSVFLARAGGLCVLDTTATTAASKKRLSAKGPRSAAASNRGWQGPPIRRGVPTFAPSSRPQTFGTIPWLGHPAAYKPPAPTKRRPTLLPRQALAPKTWKHRCMYDEPQTSTQSLTDWLPKRNLRIAPAATVTTSRSKLNTVLCCAAPKAPRTSGATFVPSTRPQTARRSYYSLLFRKSS